MMILNSRICRLLFNAWRAAGAGGRRVTDLDMQKIKNRELQLRRCCVYCKSSLHDVQVCQEKREPPSFRG